MLLYVVVYTTYTPYRAPYYGVREYAGNVGILKTTFWGRPHEEDSGEQDSRDPGNLEISEIPKMENRVFQDVPVSTRMY